MSLENLIHISFDPTLAGLWVPKLPVSLDNGEKSIYSEPDVPRICLAPSVKECFWAIYPNISNLFEHQNLPHMDFYVYAPEPESDVMVVTPETLTQQRLVLDAHVTNEHWVLCDITMRLIKKIRIYNPGQCSFVSFRPFNDPAMKRLDLAPEVINIDEWSYSHEH